MRRREFIAGLGGVITWPVVARAQQPARAPRVGYLSSNYEGEQEAQLYRATLLEALDTLGWVDGRNIRIDYRWGAAPLERARMYAAELIGLSPSLLFATNSICSDALRRETRTVPIVFANVTDPVGSGLVESMAHPAGNVTGFTNSEFPIGGKWLGMLREIAPGTRRALVVMPPGNIGGEGLYNAIEAGAPTLDVQLVAAPVLDATQIERAIKTFAKEPSGAIVVLPGFVGLNNRDLIVRLAARHHLPAMYADRSFIGSGGLMSYDTDAAELFRRAASYVNRILRGEKPGDLPVQAPTKYELMINLKTAKALGLEVPQSLLISAVKVIE